VESLKLNMVPLAYTQTIHSTISIDSSYSINCKDSSYSTEVRALDREKAENKPFMTLKSFLTLDGTETDGSQ